MELKAQYLLDQITDILQKYEIDNNMLAIDLAIFTAEQERKAIGAL